MSVRCMSWAFDVTGVTPSQKLILLALADHANDAGDCWPSIARLSERTCSDRKTVMRGISSLEQIGMITAKRGVGRQTSYHLNTSKTGPTVVQVPERDRSLSVPNRSHCGTKPVPPWDPNHQEPSRTVNNRNAREAFVPPPGVNPDCWRDFLAVRKSHKAPMSETAYQMICRKLTALAEDGWPPGDMVALAVERGWRTVFAPKDARHEKRIDNLPDNPHIAAGNRILAADRRGSVE